MKAVGRNLIIQKVEEVVGLKEKDKIFYDRHAGHQIEIEKSIYHVIKAQDVVVVL